MEVYRLDPVMQDQPPTVLVLPHDLAPITVLRPGEPPSEQWHLPPYNLTELVSRETVHQEVLEALEKASLSAATRRKMQKLIEALAD